MQNLYGVKLYSPAFCDSRNLDAMEECGINAVFLGRDALTPSFCAELNKRGLFWNIVEPVFLLDEHETRPAATLGDGTAAVDDWVRFACPSDGTHMDGVRRRLVEDIRTYNPPGVSLDFLRFFQFWETTAPDADRAALPQSCFCDECRKRMQACADAAEWRRTVVTSTAGELSGIARETEKGIRVGIHCVPWKRDMYDDAIRDIIGQDFTALALVADYLTPMIYHFMMRRESAYVREFILDMAAQGCTEILPSVQARQVYRQDKMDAREFAAVIDAALPDPSRGVLIYRWEDLADDRQRLEILRSALKG